MATRRRAPKKKSKAATSPAKTKKRARKKKLVVETRAEKVGVSSYSAVAVTYQLEMVCCGRATCRKCKGTKSIHGPYWYAYFRTWGGRKKSVYRGKVFRSLSIEELEHAERQ